MTRTDDDITLLAVRDGAIAAVVDISNEWRARYMAAHEVLLAVEAYCDAMDVPGFYAVDWEKYRQMRAAFYAYRASIEAGAPLGWAVAEEEQEVEA
jgi:hypothetical protein